MFDCSFVRWTEIWCLEAGGTLLDVNEMESFPRCEVSWINRLHAC